MRSFPKLLFCLLLALWSGAPLPAKDDATAPKSSDKTKESDKKKDDKKKDKKKDDKNDDKKKDAKKKPEDASDPNGGKLSLPLVAGHPSLGLKIPYYDVKGNLQMIYTIGVATRKDADNVEMKEVQVETYNEEGEPEMTVELPVSSLNLNTKVVTSNTPTTITREDFKLTGDSVQFNTISKEAKLVGNVHMTIYKFQDEAAKSAISPPSGASE
jgi:hypothetical protein